MTTAAAALRQPSISSAALSQPSISSAAHRPVPFRRRGHRLAAAALVLAGLSIPVTGAGSAIGATHAPAHLTVAVVADAAVGVVATGKHDV